MRKTFTILIMPAESDEDGYWVKVPALPGCVTQGETVEEALSNAKKAVEAYVLSLTDRGIPILEEGVDTSGLISAVSVEV